MTVPLDQQQIIAFNDQITEAPAVIINIGALEAAVQRPVQRFQGHELNSWPEKCRIVLQELAQGHPFEEGNKRTAARALARFFEINGAVPPPAQTIYNWVNQAVDANGALANHNLREAIHAYGNEPADQPQYEPDAPEPDEDEDPDDQEGAGAQGGGQEGAGA
jgi:death-on-curing protein